MLSNKIPCPKTISHAENIIDLYGYKTRHGQFIKVFYPKKPNTLRRRHVSKSKSSRIDTHLPSSSSGEGSSKSLSEMEEDGLIIISDSSIKVTELGKDFAQFITNYFDAYDPPSKSYNDRLAVIKKAKDAQKEFLEYVNNL